MPVFGLNNLHKEIAQNQKPGTLFEPFWPRKGSGFYALFFHGAVLQQPLSAVSGSYKVSGAVNALFAEVCGLDLFIGQQFSTRAGKGQGAGLQHIGIIGHLQGHVGVLLIQQHGDALLVHGADDIKNLPHHDGRKAKARLVQHEQLRLAHQGAAHGQHLLLAAGKGAGALPAALLQTGEQTVHPFKVFLGFGLILAQVCADLQIFQHSQVGKHPAALRRHGNAAGNDLVDGLAQQFLPVPQNGAALCLYKAGNGAHQGGLACAVGTDQGNDLAVRHVQRHTAQGLNAAIGNM